MSCLIELKVTAFHKWKRGNSEHTLNRYYVEMDFCFFLKATSQILSFPQH